MTMPRLSGCSADFCLAIKKGSEHSGNHDRIDRICGEHSSRDQSLKFVKTFVISSLLG